MGVVHISGLTDSQVSSNVISRGMTTSFPLCIISMELAAQLEHSNAHMSAEWIPRETNKEADALADGLTSGFNPTLDKSRPIDEIEWLVIPSFMEKAAEFYKDSRRTKELLAKSSSSSSVGPAKKRKKKEQYLSTW